MQKDFPRKVVYLMPQPQNELVEARCFFCGGVIGKTKKIFEKMKADKCPSICLKCCGVDNVVIYNA